MSRLRIEVSNLCGSLSLACWVILLLPQLLEQWRLKSAEGIAIGFITAWFLGDLANLVGAIWAGLRPNVILLGMWFCFSDTLLILSYFYYTNLNDRKRLPALDSENTLYTSLEPSMASSNALLSESTTPLLQDSTSALSEPSMTASHRNTSQNENWLLTTGLPMVFVIMVATLSYAISDSSAPPESQIKVGLGPEILGYISALFYLTARIPQIVQNHRRKSVEGLSMAFFILSCLGNLTYAGQIIVYRNDRQWIVSYIPWLIGSLGTIVEDLIILAQFHVYNALY